MGWLVLNVINYLDVKYRADFIYIGNKNEKAYYLIVELVSDNLIKCTHKSQVGKVSFFFFF